MNNFDQFEKHLRAVMADGERKDVDNIVDSLKTIAPISIIVIDEAAIPEETKLRYIMCKLLMLAAESYAKAKWVEACELTRESMINESGVMPYFR